ncbi:UvrD/REP helicase N-terminal domain-containing protein [Selenomonas sp. GACV-9]|uniref:UvrD-helicase domain-containing protein n=1 Tax=Selenomonas sp. GACV-9 TaxID=3158782 RepID=UPI0008EA5158|nr:UvrD/REP helicase N-terminal domain-containing protein [Selenomonas ruminantium]
MSDVKVVIGDTFLDSFARLPSQAQKHTSDFLVKFRSNPTSPAINYEKIASKLDKKVWSVRIDDTYRGIVLREDKSGVFLLVWVDHHDEAYAWAERKRCNINPFTGAIQLYTVQEITEQVQVKGIFEDITDDNLLKLGVPEEQLPFIRTLTSKDMFIQSKGIITPDVYEGLSWILEDIPVDEVIELLEAERENAAPKAMDLRAALDNVENQRFFRVVEGEDDLQAMLERPLEKWRVFLHPAQRKIVNKDYSGSARVTGGAGTGKTVVAMHRARRLAGKLTGRQRVLFTTFTANLAADIQDNLRKICTNDELRHIEVINLDSWVSDFMRNAGYDARIEYNDAFLKNCWENAIGEAMAEDTGLTVDFYAEEWARVVIPQHAMNLAKYIRCSRNGRGVRLNRNMRKQVWAVFESYQRQMKAAGKRDVQWAMDECRFLIDKQHETLYPYIVVDEGQDFSPIAMELIRSIAGEEHPNDIFIVGDSHQRIYRNKTVLSKCGIQVRGRSSILRINYRTTEETRAYAFALLEGISFDDLDGEALDKDECQSLTHGEKPMVKYFRSANKEIEFIEEQINSLEASGIPLKDICITARTHNMLDNYIKAFTECGFRCYELKKEKMDDRHQEGIRLATMHRVKGLEFQYVFIAGVNKGIVPLSNVVDIDDSVAKQEAEVSEKCLLYVALTRAQKGAYITSYGKKSDLLR